MDNFLKYLIISLTVFLITIVILDNYNFLIKNDERSIFSEKLDSLNIELNEKNFKLDSLLIKNNEKEQILQTLPIINPLAKNELLINSKFGYRRHPILNYYRLHSGIDITANKNDSVFASGSGRVLHSKYNKGYGKYVVIEHNDSIKSLYGHLSNITVNEDDEVTQRQLIGYIGRTGLATNYHLHYEIKINDKPINPLEFIK